MESQYSKIKSQCTKGDLIIKSENNKKELKF